MFRRAATPQLSAVHFLDRLLARGKATRLILSERVRVLITITSVTALLGFVGWVFWAQDIRFMLPTPRPPDLVQPPVGAALPIDVWLARMGLSADERPVHLHVFNPDCPCSRFNADHIRDLVRAYGQDVRFVGLVQISKGANAEEMRDAREEAAALNLGMPLWLDEGGAIARAAGAYSTPQAVLVTAAGALVFRGNYNVSRYHVNPRTEFARLALESLVGSRRAFDDPNLPAYGCELPKNTVPAIVPVTMVKP